MNMYMYINLLRASLETSFNPFRKVQSFLYQELN